jgi:hypothetical protein
MEFQQFMAKNLGFHKILYFPLRCNFFKNSHFKNNLITVQPEKVLWPWPVFFSGRIFERPVRILNIYIYIYKKSAYSDIF